MEKRPIKSVWEATQVALELAKDKLIEKKSLSQDTRIFAIVGTTAQMLFSDPFGLNFLTPITIYVQEKYLSKKKQNDNFTKLFIHHLISIFENNSIYEGKGKLKEIDSNLFEISNETIDDCIQLEFTPWSRGQNILGLIKSQHLIHEQVLFDHMKNNLLKVYQNQIVPVPRNSRMDIDGNFKSKSTSELLGLIDFASYLEFCKLIAPSITLNYSSAFKDHMRFILLKNQSRENTIERLEAFKFLSKSALWHPNLESLITMELIPTDIYLSQPFAFIEEAATKAMLLEFRDSWSYFSKKLESINSSGSSNSCFLNDDSFKLLALIVSVIGPAIKFEESYGYFMQLLQYFFGQDFADVYEGYDIRDDPVFVLLYTELLGVRRVFTRCADHKSQVEDSLMIPKVVEVMAYFQDDDCEWTEPSFIYEIEKLFEEKDTHLISNNFGETNDITFFSNRI